MPRIRLLAFLLFLLLLSAPVEAWQGGFGGGTGGGGSSPPASDCASANELALFTGTSGTQLGCTGLVWDTGSNTLTTADNFNLVVDTTFNITGDGLTIDGYLSTEDVIRVGDAATVPAAIASFGQIAIDPADGILKIRKSSGDGGGLQSLEGTGGGGATFTENEFTPTASQTIFTLTATYVGANGLSVIGLNTAGGYAEGTHYTISGTTFTWLDTPFTLDTADRLVVKFQTT